MTRTDGMELHDAMHAIEEAHPGWHIYHSDTGRIWATDVHLGPKGGGQTVDADSVETIEHSIEKREWDVCRDRAQVAREQIRKGIREAVA